jgi:hypothetical protein
MCGIAEVNATISLQEEYRLWHKGKLLPQVKAF